MLERSDISAITTAAIMLFAFPAFAEGNSPGPPPTLEDEVGTPRYGFAEDAESAGWAPKAQQAEKAQSATTADEASRAEEADRAERADKARNSGQRTLGFCNPERAEDETDSTYHGDILQDPDNFCPRTATTATACGPLAEKTFQFGVGAISTVGNAVPTSGLDKNSLDQILNISSSDEDAAFDTVQQAENELCQSPDSGDAQFDFVTNFQHDSALSGNGLQVYSWTCQNNEGTQQRSCSFQVEHTCTGITGMKTCADNSQKLTLDVQNGCIQDMRCEDP